MNETMMDERSEALALALHDALDRRAFPLHTGGGVYVMAVELDDDRPGSGRQVWLTREDGWMVGFYDFTADGSDEGVVVRLELADDDDPAAVAGAVNGIVSRVAA